jgi:hypothetical protein
MKSFLFGFEWITRKMVTNKMISVLGSEMVIAWKGN